MLIDYSRLLTKDSELIPEDRLLEIKNRAEKESRIFRAKHQAADVVTTLFKKADEYAYISAINRDLNNDERALLAANIMFTNVKMAELLKSGNFDKETLKIYIDLVSYVKRKLETDGLSADQEKYQVTAEKYTRKLIKFFRDRTGIVSANQIINKIYEIMTYEPELLDTDTKKSSR